MFKDWFGNNPISITLSDMFVLTSTLIADPSKITDALSDMWDDICSGNFNLIYLICLNFRHTMK